MQTDNGEVEWYNHNLLMSQSEDPEPKLIGFYQGIKLYNY